MLLPFHKIGKNDAPQAGGKGASLGEMTQAGIPVPPGFVVLAEAFETFIDTNNLRVEIQDILRHLDHNSVTSIEGASEKIQELVLNGEIPSEIQKEIKKYQKNLNATFVAVRSSATAEDGIEHAWAGQLDTYLNVSKNDILKKIQSCWASLFTPRALFYRSEKGLANIHISVAVVVQSMVDAQSAGVAFSVHPVTENTDEIVIEGSWGLGEAVVSGEVTPDSYVVSKSSKETLSQHIADKKKGIFRNIDGLNEWRQISEQEREKPVLTKKALNELSELVIHIENHYGFPCDIEWAYAEGKIYILQARPITTLTNKSQKIQGEKWEKMVARHWYPLSWSGSAHIQQKGLKFGKLYWKVQEYLAVRFGGQHITDFCPNQNFIDTNLGDLLSEINPDLDSALDEIINKIKELIIVEPGKTRKDAERIFEQFKLADGIMLMSFYFGPLCQEILKSKIGEEILRKYQIAFSIPSEPTLWVREGKEIREVKKMMLSRKISQKDIEKRAENIAHKYGFIHSDIRANSWTKQDYLEEFHRPLIEHGEENIKHFKTNDAYILWLKSIISKISFTFDEGKCATIRTNWALRETINNCGAKEDEVMKCSEEEFLEWIKTDKLPSVNLDEREKFHVMYTKGDIYEEYFDKEKINIFLQKEGIDEFREIQKNVQKLEGQTAFKGKVRGIVRKTYCEKDANNLTPGEILVSTMTQPELMKGMINAAAFITDEGGLLCHAAIIARELQKPCIIGTKIATKILEDGDLVEVDADSGIVKILEKKKNIFEESWQIGATRNMPLWHDILCLYGWEDNMRDYDVDEKCKCLFVIENATHATMFMQAENQKKYFEATAKLCKDGKTVKKLRKKYELYARDVQKNLEELMKEESVENLETFLKDYQRFTAGLWITTGFGRIGTENLQKALIETGIKQQKIPEYISILTYPEEHTPLFISQKDILILAEKIQSGKKIKREKEIATWLENHKYIPVNYCEDPWTKEDVERQLDDILEQDCKEALEKFNKSHADKLKQKKNLQQELNQDICDISDALAEATSLNEYRKNIFCRLSYSIRFFFEKMMKKIGSSDWRDAYYCTPEELLQIMRGEKIDISKIKEDRKKCVFVREQDTIVWGKEKEIKNFFEKIYHENEDTPGALTGFSANKGKIIGTVKVVLSTKDFHKVNRGDILVATMTSVDFVPIMEKAGAFVTNEGGITSHAAIVAREMNKPCIIGTKNATRVLHDGDLIEVDADNGVIKILKKEESSLKNKDLEVWIERKQSVFSMSVFHELESKIMSEHLGGGFKTQICFMRDKVCSYIHEVGDLEHVIQNIAQKLQKNSDKDRENYIKEMNRWEKKGEKIIKEGPRPVLLSEGAMREYLENYKNIGYWTTVVPYFLLEGINALEKQSKYKKLQKICERLRSNSLYPILNEKITLKVLEYVSLKMGLSHEDAYYITWQETIGGLDGKIPKNRESIGQRKYRDNAFYRNKYGEVLFLDNEEDREKLRKISYPGDTKNIITGKTSYPGKVTGRVKILRTGEDMQHFEKGDILVSPNSNPSLIPCIKKCSAIVTDEGGVSCHAAIISRELKIPCIIGTKIATKVLQDGDMVEVNTDNGTVKILEKENEIQWGFTYDRQMSYQRISLFHNGYCPRLSEFFDVTLENELYRIQDGIVSVFYDEVGHKQAFNKIRALLGGEKKTQWYKKIYNTITKDYREFISFLDQGEKKKNIPGIQKALTKHMEHNRKISLSTWLLYSYLEEILSDAVKIMLEKKGIKDWQRIFEILGQPDEMIPSDRWEYDIAEAVLADNEKQKKIIKKLCLKYRSYGMYDVMFDGKSEKDIREKIIGTSKNDAQKTIKNLQEKYSKQKKKLKKIGKISWGESESSLMQLYRLYANFKDWKNFHRERSSYQIREIYQEIAKKYKQKQENLSYMTKEEILDGIEQKKWGNEDEIQKRKENSALIFIGKSIKNVHSTQKLEELDQKLFIKQNTISGTTAFPGNISGTARIINSHDDLRKLKKGDIMISSTTRPDYLPFIADIAGFVTNEGGALSHAAILAREIKKPCIIGTKIATQVIKSGDEITLDGENGIITIHQKKRNYFDDKKLLSEGGRACYLYPNRIFSTRMNIPHPLWENHLMVISTSENHKVNWYFAVKDENEFDYTLKRVLSNKDMLQEGEKEINRLVEKAKKTLKKEYKTAKAAWNGYQNFISIYEEIAIVPTFVRQLDRAVVRSLRESIHEEDFAVATYASKRTYQRQEEVALLELRIQFDEKITTDIQKKLDKIYTQYFTSSLGYFEEHIKTKSDYLEKLLGSSKKEAKNHLKKILEEEKEIMGKKLKLKKSFPEKVSVIDIAGFLVYLKDHYKFQINRVQHYAVGLFESISTITGYDGGMIRDMTPEEIKNLLLSKKIDEKNIKNRIASHAYIYNDSGKPELIIGEEAKIFSQKYLATNNEQKTFSGRVACKGHGTGKARIILGTRDFHKMEQGDILVVMNTSPDFVPIMKKAAAIVAEEGGITGHVSVVSREFGIPSVVGIKQITSIIQDGEIIEVDAEKGIVIRHN